MNKEISLKHFKTNLLVFFLVTSFFVKGYASTDSDSITFKEKSYEFIIQDSPLGLYTMRQTNVNFLSAYRLFSDELHKMVEPRIARVLQIAASLYLMPLTHEEGHRSILTVLGIGSISQPLYNKEGIAYVNGVRDAELIKLRDENLPAYIRLHTAGIESDYMIAKRAEEALFFNKEDLSVLFPEIYVRRMVAMAYFASSVFPKSMPFIAEKDNELLNDIVGHDVYGAIKNLHRPADPFKRYNFYNDIREEEKPFLWRVGLRSLLNMASPYFFKPLHLIKKENFRLSVSSGYLMTPFGDHIDENFLIQINNKVNLHAYLRQFQNKTNWFAGAGLKLIDYEIAPGLLTTAESHFWTQPKDLSFTTSESFVGGAIDLNLSYRLLKARSGNALSLAAGMIYKTKGYLPEEVMLGEYWGARVGLTLHLMRER
jgi:hypothetical protein